MNNLLCTVYTILKTTMYNLCIIYTILITLPQVGLWMLQSPNLPKDLLRAGAWSGFVIISAS